MLVLEWKGLVLLVRYPYRIVKVRLDYPQRRVSQLHQKHGFVAGINLPKSIGATFETERHLCGISRRTPHSEIQKV